MIVKKVMFLQCLALVKLVMSYLLYKLYNYLSIK